MSTINRRTLLFVVLLSSLLVLASYPCSVKGISSSHFISIQYLSQEKDYYCGPASIQMALGYLTYHIPSQDQIAFEAHINAFAKITYTYCMRNAFDNRGYTKVYEQTLDLEALKLLNSNGYVVLILIYFDVTHQYQHYVLVVGYDNDGIYVNDPWPTSWSQPQGRTTGVNASISNNLLDDLWSCQPFHWGLVVPYTPESVMGVPWWQEYWSALVLVSCIVAAVVAAVILMKKKTSGKSAVESQYYSPLFFSIACMQTMLKPA